MIKLSMSNSYPESWYRQTPKGFDNSQIKIVNDTCDCGGCNCNPMPDKLFEEQVSFEE